MLYYLLHKTPLMENGEWVPAAVLTSDDLSGFAHAVVVNKATIENVLDIEVRGDVRSKPVSQLNVILKLVGRLCIPLNKQKKRGRMVYRYGLDAAGYRAMTELVARRGRTRGYETLYDLHGWDKAELVDEDAEMDAATVKRRQRTRRVKPVRPRRESALASLWSQT